MVVATAKEVWSGGDDVNPVGGTRGDTLAWLELEGRAVDHLEEVGMGAGDAVGGVVAGQHPVLRRDAADRPLVVEDGQVIQSDVPES